ncbi:MAG TPA: SMR family transporter [Conexibacter sp.]|jgi:quaternary ammonium compound-resistance protein SugE
MAWITLFVAALLETAWAIGLKYSDGFSKVGPSIPTVAAMIASLALLSYATKTLPIGTAYGVWVGIGAAGTAILGIVLFNEPLAAGRVFFLVLLLASVIGLKATSGH